MFPSTPDAGLLVPCLAPGYSNNWSSKMDYISWIEFALYLGLAICVFLRAWGMGQ